MSRLLHRIDSQEAKQAPMIELSHIYKRFNHQKNFVVNDITLTIAQGETFVLLGSSGSGKTTLLKMINRLVKPTKGDIFINGQNIKQYETVKLRRSMGYVFQKVGLFPHMTIETNISIALQLMGKNLETRIERAHELLNLIGLDPEIYAKRYPHELSGGQSQRVGVARALAADPNILLMDEPFGALDAITRNDLQENMIELRKQMKKTIVFVTHDIVEAFRLADRIAVMHHGILEQVGSKKEILENPQTDFVKELIQTTELPQE